VVAEFHIGDRRRRKPTPTSGLAGQVVAGFHTGDKARAGVSRIMATDSTRRLHHQTPARVNSGAVFHIRIRSGRDSDTLLTEARAAQAVLNSAAFYHQQATWHCHLFLLMPDHLHALLSFPLDHDMRAIIGRWKAWQVRTTGIRWQKNFFDHRIRSHPELQLKAHYIRQNPVVKGLCAKASDWPWVISPE
jgi:REP element-mobilizing transposase RayT